MHVSCLKGGLARRLSLGRAVAERAAACAHHLHRRLDGDTVQVGALDDPRRLCHHLACRQGPLGHQPLDDGRTDPQLLRSLFACQPVCPLRDIWQAILLPDTGDTVCPPGLPRPSARAEAVERGRNGHIATDL
jgi:hypothetical protein